VLDTPMLLTNAPSYLIESPIPAPLADKAGAKAIDGARELRRVPVVRDPSTWMMRTTAAPPIINIRVSDGMAVRVQMRGPRSQRLTDISGIRRRKTLWTSGVRA
jgi:hypothetical protein